MALKSVHTTLSHVPLSKVVHANGMLYLSGEASIDWTTRATVQGDIRAQTRKTLENLRDTLASVGSTLDKVVKVNVFLTDPLNDFQGMNEVYTEFFSNEPPARSTVGVSSLVRPDLIVEIEAIALP
jgi:2-iminobutanoate/2-iminopropanoate deaminase